MLLNEFENQNNLSSQKRTFTFDLNNNKTCNLRCKYCVINFENPKIPSVPHEVVVSLIKQIHKLLETPKFQSNFDTVQISFFGGEPTLNLNSIIRLIHEFENDDRISFFLYSNGYKIPNQLFEILNELKFKCVKGNAGYKTPKFLTQISFDGSASHDIDRVTITGKGSSQAVKSSINMLAQRRIPFVVHPTISAKNFNCIAKNYFEFLEFSKTIGVELNYSPTIDYLSDFKFSNSQLNDIFKTLESEFNKIAKHEIQFFKKFGHFNFGWFNPSKAICSAGDGYVGVDLDGSVVPCHGCFSTSDESLKLCSIHDEDFTDKILNYTDKFHETLTSDLPKECQVCPTHYCLKCNAAKYNFSKIQKTQNLDFKKWVDYPNQPDLCKIYKFIGRYRLALLNVLKEVK